MSGVGAALTLALALVLGLSGALKLLPRGRLTPGELDALGVPRPLRRPWFTVALPVGELLLALALLLAPGPAFTVAAAATVLLMAAFVVVVARVVRRRDRVECSCFGMLRSPVGGVTVARNCALLVAAVGVAVGARSGAVLGMPRLDGADWTWFFATAAAVLAVVAVLLAVSRTPADQSASAPVQDGTPWPAPDVEVLRGAELVPVRELARERPVLLVLLSAECHACEKIAPQLGGWRARLDGAVDVAVLTSDTAEAMAAGHPVLDAPLHFGARGVLSAAGISGYPAALLIDRDGMVAGGPALGSDDVELFVAVIADAVAAAGRGDGAPNGSPNRPGASR